MGNIGIGIDVGSTTVKIVVLSENGEILYKNYVRHFSEVKATLLRELKAIESTFSGYSASCAITGSAGLGLSSKAGIGFVQEVYSSSLAVRKHYPDADAVIELGGEDAKIIFLTNGIEQRMNGSCAGGTGAFIDQMATLLGLSVGELDALSEKATKVYPIASRCGVFAKSDIQPLINQGAQKEDIAASIFQAVVDQTISGLAQGREIKGKVVFLGGPLSFLNGLRKAFTRTLKLDDAHAVFPEDGPVFIALGAAMYARSNEKPLEFSEWVKKIESAETTNDIVTTEPLFASESEYEEFLSRHKSNDAKTASLKGYRGKAYLGIDAGSTTTKVALIDEENRILFSHYVSNKGKPLDIITEQIGKIYAGADSEMEIVSCAVTGYGEELIKAGLGVDFGIVETIAHFKAASYFCPDVDFIIDIGGQDIKCFRIKNHAIDSIILNEACSSGCGSFIQTFAEALGYDIDTFAKMGLFASNPVDLGSRCTVFMNSSVKQAQKDGASIRDISAGLSQSIIKNAIYKVIRAKNVEELGKNIVAQGGTFLNDAVLRSFEKELDRSVIRPGIAGLMGAFGAAIYAKEHSKGKSTLIGREELERFSYRSASSVCKGCTAHCSLNILTFSDGKRFISGNRCDKVSANGPNRFFPSLYDFKYKKILSYGKETGTAAKRKVGLPLALNFYELIPFYATLFDKIGFEVVLSEETSRKTYLKGQHTIASDTICYPAKLMHGQIEDLLDKGVDFVFYPCMTYNIDESDSDNHYNCPVVAYYPETLKGNNPRLNRSNFLAPYLDLNNKHRTLEVFYRVLRPYGVDKRTIKSALGSAYLELDAFHAEISETARKYIEEAREEKRKIIVLAGRPYHVDPEINHGISRYMSSMGLAVLSEDALAQLSPTPDMQILNQWTYHSRLFKAANYVIGNPDMQMVQLVSFGCGMDAITADELRRILEKNGKLYTQLKIDEINNLGALKIRIRSLLAAIDDELKVKE